jgi:hypothetical protein
MNWIKDICEDIVCGTGLGVVKGVFGISLFTEEETAEINDLKNLALSVMEKAPEIVTEPVICEAIRQGKQSGLDAFAKEVKNTLPEEVATVVVSAAQSFKQRFGDVLTGACMNLVGC